MKVGDRVKVTNQSSSMVGEFGTITRVHEGYDVLLDSDNSKTGRGGGKFELYFHKDELELLK